MLYSRNGYLVLMKLSLKRYVIFPCILFLLQLLLNFTLFSHRFGIISHFSKRFHIQVSSNRIDLTNFFIHIVVAYDSIVSFAWNTFIVHHRFHFAILFLFISLTILVVLWGAFWFERKEAYTNLSASKAGFFHYFNVCLRLTFKYEK